MQEEKRQKIFPKMSLLISILSIVSAASGQMTLPPEKPCFQLTPTSAERAPNASYITYLGEPFYIPSTFNAVIDCSPLISAALDSYERVCITWYIDNIPVFHNTSLNEISLDKKFLYVFNSDECRFIDGYRSAIAHMYSCEATQCLNVEHGVADFSHTNAGNQFYLGFFENRFSVNCHNEINPPIIWAGTTEQQVVQFTVETYNKVIYSGVIFPGSYTYVSIPLELIVRESAPAAMSEKFKGIRIKAEGDKKLIVLGQYEEFLSNDAYLALPVISRPLNKTFKYILVSVRGYNTYDTIDTDSVGLIIGTENDTKVTVIPTPSTSFIFHTLAYFSAFVHGIPDELNTVTINRYQSLYLQGHNEDLSGTLVMADKPVSVFSGHKCANVPHTSSYCDMLIEQIPPTDTLGTEVVTVPLLTKQLGDLIKVIAVENYTIVALTRTNYYSGVVTSDPQFVLNSGEFREIFISDYTLIQSNRPISVYQFSTSSETDVVTNSDPFMLMVPSRKQYLNTYYMATAPYSHELYKESSRYFGYSHYINIAVPVEYFRSNHILIDNSPVTSVYKPIRLPDNSIWGYATQMRIGGGSHVIKHLNPIAIMAVTVYGFSYRVSYGFAGGMKLEHPDNGNTAVYFSDLTYSVKENNSTVQVELLVSNPISVNLTVQIVYDDVSTTGGTDYEFQSLVLTIPANATKTSFNIAIIDDMMHEANETFYLRIGSLSNGIIRGKPDQAEVIILNDDVVVVNFSHSVYYAKEELVQPVLVLDNPTSGAVIPVFVIEDSTTETHVVSFSADVNTTVFNISITNDNILEGSRYLYITINNNSLPDGVVTGYPSHATIIVMKAPTCTYMGMFYEMGSIIEPNCTTRCTCVGGSFSCTQQQCIIDGPTCYAFGYSHYQTFDLQHYDFYGKCEYVLVQPCDGTGFTITGGYYEQDELLNYVRIVVPSDNLEVILEGRGNSNRTIIVNGVIEVVSNDRYVLQTENFEISTIGGNFHVFLVTYQVKITWDGSYGAGITVAHTWFNKLCGLCGNYSNNPNDDFRTPNGEVGLDPGQFGTSWLYKNTSDNCIKASSSEFCPANVANEAYARCNELYSGIFNICNSIIDPDPYIDKCVTDYCLCHTDNRENCYCNSLAVYAAVCAAKRVVISNWREVFCRIQCPSGMIYQQCGPWCPMTCSGYGNATCYSGCAASCFCPTEKLLSDRECVEVSKCPAQLYPYNQGQLCAVNTTTGLVYTESSTKGGTYEVLDSVNCTEYKLSHTNNANSGEVILSVPLPVFEKSYRNLIVNTNGFISFGQSLKHLRPTSFPLESVDIIAPFWTEIDISKSGNVFFQEVVDNEVMEKINDDIKTAYPSLTSFRVHWAFIATWENVSIYNHISNNQEQLTFQAILATNGRHTLSLFLYQSKHILGEVLSSPISHMSTHIGYSIGKKYMISSANAVSSHQILLSHTPNQLILRLDDNEIQDSGCNSKGAAITDRKYIPIIGGGLVTVSAPCYKPQADKILCKFEHVQTIGKLNSSSVGLCPLPLFSKLGQHVLWISDDDGATFNYYTVLNIVPLIHHVPDVMITDDNGHEHLNAVLIPMKTYNVSIRNEPWDDQYKIVHMQFEKNKWKESQIKVTRSFKHAVRDHNRIISTPVSVIQVIKKVDSIEVSYVSSVFSLSNRNNLLDVCRNWEVNEIHKGTVTIFVPCPCSLQQARLDPKYMDDVLCTSEEVAYFWAAQNCETNKEAYHCVISKLAMYNGAGQQCCYDDSGLLITSSTGRGTIHRSSVNGINYFSYFENDYFPYLVCCPDSCDLYYKQRPTDDCSSYIL